MGGMDWGSMFCRVTVYVGGTIRQDRTSKAYVLVLGDWEGNIGVLGFFSGLHRSPRVGCLGLDWGPSPCVHA